MNIMRIEKLSLSHAEDKAFDLVKQVCGGISRESNDPILKERAQEAYRKLSALAEYIEEVVD